MKTAISLLQRELNFLIEAQASQAARVEAARKEAANREAQMADFQNEIDEVSQAIARLQGLVK